MTTPVPPLTTSSLTQVPADKKLDLVLSNVDPFAIWAVWISISAGTDRQYPPDPQTWGASIVDENTGETLLRCQLHISGPEMSATETNSLWLGGLVLADHQSPFKLSFVTDPNIKHMYVRANGGVYYSTVGPAPHVASGPAGGES